MVDAVTGVMIIALTAAVALSALNLTRRVESRATNQTAATASFRYLMATTPRVPGDATGTLNGFRYRTRVTTEAIDKQTLCRLRIDLTQRTPPRQKFSLEGLRPCVATVAL